LLNVAESRLIAVEGVRRPRIDDSNQLEGETLALVKRAIMSGSDAGKRREDGAPTHPIAVDTGHDSNIEGYIPMM